MVVQTTPVFILVTGMAMSAAGDETAIKSGNWEYSAAVAGVTQLPPGMQPSPDIRLGPEGLTFNKTRCITTADPFSPMHDHPGEECKIDKTDVNGGTLSWYVTCTTPKITIREDWIEHYHGETMDGQFTLRSTMPVRPPIERTQQLKGHYLGPCAEQ